MASNSHFILCVWSVENQYQLIQPHYSNIRFISVPAEDTRTHSWTGSTQTCRNVTPLLSSRSSHLVLTVVNSREPEENKHWFSVTFDFTCLMCVNSILCITDIQPVTSYMYLKSCQCRVWVVGSVTASCCGSLNKHDLINNLSVSSYSRITAGFIKRSVHAECLIFLLLLLCVKRFVLVGRVQRRSRQTQERFLPQTLN